MSEVRLTSIAEAEQTIMGPDVRDGPPPPGRLLATHAMAGHRLTRRVVASFPEQKEWT